MRKYLTQIEKLRADCRYLLTMDIRSREALDQREREVLEEEKRLKQQSKLTWNLQEDEGYRRYQELEKELQRAATKTAGRKAFDSSDQADGSGASGNV